MGQSVGTRKTSPVSPFRVALTALVIFILCVSVSAAQQFDTDMWSQINVAGTPSSRTAFLEKLGVPKTIASLAANSDYISSPLVWQPIRTAAPEQTALLFIPVIGAMQSAYLYLLHRSNQRWTITDHLGFACPFSDDVSMTLTRLHSNRYKSILVRNVATGWGTGVLFKNFEVFDVRNGRFHTILSTSSYLDADPWPSMIPTHIRSQFIVVPARTGAARAIEQIRSTTHKHHLKVQRRYFLWSKTKQMFVPTPFQSVQAP